MPRVSAISGSFDINIKPGLTAIDRVIQKTQNVTGALIETKGAEKALGDEFLTTAKKSKTAGVEVEKVGKKGKESFEKTKKAVGDTNKELEKTESKASDVISALAGIATAIGFKAVLGDIVSVTGQFERYNAILKTSYGSASQASTAFAQIREIAKTTPFQLENVTQSWIGLKNRGIEPTAETIKRIGDLASSQGRNIEDAVQAVTAAMTGETEMLKGFGIVARQEGDKMRLSFKGVNTEIERTPTAIFEALTAMGAMEGVAGSMDGIAQTMEGAISNMEDNVTELKNAVGEDLAPVIKTMIASVASVISSILQWRRENPALAATIVQVATGITALLTLFIGGNGLISAMKTLKPVVDALGISMKTAFGPVGLVIAGISIAITALIYKMNELKVAEENLRKGQENYNASLGRMSNALSKLGTQSLSVVEAKLKDFTKSSTDSSVSAEQMNRKLEDLRINGELLAKEMQNAGLNATQFLTRLRSEDPRMLATTLKELRREMDRFAKESNKDTGDNGSSGFLKDSLAGLENQLKNLKEKQTKTVVAGSKEWDELGRKIDQVEDKIKSLKGSMSENIDTGIFENLKNSLAKASPEFGKMLGTTFGKSIQGIMQGVSAYMQQYVQMLNASANLAEAKGRRLSGISNWIAEGMILNIDKNLKAQKAAADEELRIIEEKNQAIAESERKLQEELDAILNDYKNKRKVELDAEYNAEIEKRRLELEAQYQFIEDNTALDAEANLAKLMEFDRFEEEKEALRRQYEERLIQDTEQKEAENLEIMQEARDSNISELEAMQKRKEEIAAAEIKREKAAEAEKAKIQRQAAEIQYASELYAFTARKAAKIAEAKMATMMAVMNAVSGGIQLAASFPPISIPIGLAFGAQMTAMALKTGQMTQQAIAMELPPLPPQFAKGGEIGGMPHSRGGTLIEAERGEFIVNARDAQANLETLKNINAGRGPSGMNATLTIYNSFQGESYYEIKDKLMIDIRDSLRSAYAN